MQLVLSSTALPGATLDDLRRAARRRRLHGLELTLRAAEQLATGAACEPCQNGRDVSGLASEPPPIRWLVMPERETEDQLLYWGRAAREIGAGLVVQQPLASLPADVPAALLHEASDLAAAQRAAAWARLHDAATCLAVTLDSPAPDVLSAVLEVTLPYLAHVRLLGAGPESQTEAQGTDRQGALFSRLALGGYAGTIALAPSSEARQDAWHTWLFEGRGWGCGTAAQKRARQAAP